MPTPSSHPDDEPPHLPQDYLTEADLIALGIDPDLLRQQAPWLVEYTGHGGVPCWASSDIATYVRRNGL